MANNLGGLNRLYIDGVLYPIDGACTVSPQNRVRTAMPGSDGTYAEKSEAKMPTIKATLREYGNLPLTALQSKRDMVIQVVSNNGRSWTLRGAFVQGEIDYNSMDNTIEITFAGSQATQGDGGNFS